MRALLDTHALLWFLLDDPKLPQVAKGIIADGSNDIAVSPASYCLRTTGTPTWPRPRMPWTPPAAR
jgi:hypothetical protein